MDISHFSHEPNAGDFAGQFTVQEPPVTFTFNDGEWNMPRQGAIATVLALLAAFACHSATAQVFIAAADFSVESNPNGVWRYGYSPGDASNFGFVPFDAHPTDYPPGAVVWIKSGYENSRTPAAWKNLSGPPTFGALPGPLSLHPGPRPNTDFAVLRFTAPVPGDYSISGQFMAGDVGVMSGRVITKSDFIRGTLASFNSTDPNPTFFFKSIHLSGGQPVDFIVGNNGDFVGGTTPVSVYVTLLGSSGQACAPEPPSILTGRPATLYSPNGQQHVFYRDDAAALQHVYYDPGSNRRIGPERWATGVAGDPATLLTSNGQQHVFYRGVDNGIYQVYYDPNSNAVSQPEKWASNGLGAVSTILTAGGQQHVFYLGSGSAGIGIYRVYFAPSTNRSIGPQAWYLGGAAGGPATMLTGEGQQHAIFTRGAPDFGLSQVWSSGSNPRKLEQWAMGATGMPATFVASDGKQHVFYRGSDSGLYQAFYNPQGNVRSRELWEIGVAGDPAAILGTNGQEHVFYRGMDSAIHQVFYDPANDQRSQDEIWALGATSDPAALVTSSGQQHVFFRGSDHSLYQVYYDPGSNKRIGPEKWP